MINEVLSEDSLSTPRYKDSFKRAENLLILLSMVDFIEDKKERRGLEKFKKPNLVIQDSIYSYSFAFFVDHGTQSEEKGYF